MQETQETRVLSLGREEPLEEEMATHQEAGGLQPMGVRRDWAIEHAGTQQHKTTDNSTPWKIYIYFVTAFQDQIEPELYSINLSYWGKKVYARSIINDYIITESQVVLIIFKTVLTLQAVSHQQIKVYSY